MFISNAQKEKIKLEFISLKSRINEQEKSISELTTIVRLLGNKVESIGSGKNNSGWDIQTRKNQSDRMKEIWKQKKEINGNNNRTGG